MLIDIFKKFNGALALKGGTCTYLFYDLPRISLDLDFDCLKPFSSEDIDNLKIMLEKHGRIKESRDKRFTIFFLVNYKKDAPNIKVELNKRLWKNNTYKSIWLLGVQMKIADETCLATNKLVALTDRKITVARDLFDLHYFLTLGYTFNEDLIYERTNKSLKEYLEFLIRFIQKAYSPKNLLEGLGDVLTSQQKDWARKELLQSTSALLEKIRNGKGSGRDIYFGKH